MRPVSSETTSERQSVSSVMPMAARWRVPSFERERGIGGQRQEAGRRRDAVLLHDYGAIVQRQTRMEDGKQQVAREPRLQCARRSR